MYTERDAKRMQDWSTIHELLRDVLDLYHARLASDSSADKPTFESELYHLKQTARAQANLWRNPDTAEQQKTERAHNIYSL